MLGLLPVEGACGGQQLVDIAAAEASVSVVAVEFGHIEIDVAVADVSVSGLQNFFIYSICSMMCPEACGSMLGGSTLSASISW